MRTVAGYRMGMGRGRWRLHRTKTMMPEPCPECGAIYLEDSNCQAIFDSFLVLEYSDPAYGQVHLLTVACFMIQHGRYSDEALVWMEQKLRAHVEEGIPAGQIRRQASKEAGQGRRTWKVTRQPDAPRLPKIAWSMTIADVAAKSTDAASYRELVKLDRNQVQILHQEALNKIARLL